MTDVDAIARRADAATPGPWEVGELFPTGWRIDLPTDQKHLRWSKAPVANVGYVRADALFIAHARQDVPALCDEVRRLRAALTAVVEDATAGHLATAAAIARAALGGLTP